eukprot:441376-Pyramimonas_sp.AAC.1
MCALMSESCCRMTASLPTSLLVASLLLWDLGGACVVSADADVALLVAGSLGALWCEVDRPSLYLGWKCLQSALVHIGVGLLGFVVRIAWPLPLSFSVGVEGSCPFFLWTLLVIAGRSCVHLGEPVC